MGGMNCGSASGNQGWINRKLDSLLQTGQPWTLIDLFQNFETAFKVAVEKGRNSWSVIDSHELRLVIFPRLTTLNSNHHQKHRQTRG